MSGLTLDVFMRDRFTGAFNRMSANATQQTQRLTAQLSNVGNRGDQLSDNLNEANRNSIRSIGQINTRLNELERTREISIDLHQIRNVNAEISQLQAERQNLLNAGSGTGLGMGKMAALGLTGSAVAIVAGLKSVGEQAVEVEAKYARFEAVLTNTLGGRSEAQAAMSQLTRFASETPFQVDELTDSFVKLANQGFKPTGDEMTSLGDIAASKGKSFDQLTEALIDAEVGEFERLKEFGIRASKEGDKVTFTFKGQQTVIANSEKAIRQYILGLGKMSGVAGSMASISKTTGGKISNMTDNVDQLYLAIGERLQPATHAGLGLMSKWVAKATEWAKIPVSDTLEKERTQVNLLAAELVSAETSLERRNEIYNTLKEIAPDVVKGIDAENIAMDKLRENVEAYNLAAIQRIVLAKKQEEYEKMLGKAESKRDDAGDYALDLDKQIQTAIEYLRNDYSVDPLGKKTPVDNSEKVSALTDILYKIADPAEKGQKAIDYLSSFKASTLGEYGAQQLIGLMSPNIARFKKRAGKASELENLANKMQEDIDKVKAGMAGMGLTSNLTTTDSPLLGGTTGSIPGNTLNSGVDSIRGDVAASKNITINLEALIKEVKNEFNGGNFDTADIEEKLKAALMNVLNDANNIF